MVNPRGCKFALAAFVFLHSACSNASSKRLHKKLHNHIDCICLTYLHCVFANVSSYVRMESQNGCNYLTSLFCAFSYVSSNCLPENRHINLAFLSACVYSKHLHKKIQSHNCCICLTCSPLCVFKCVLKQSEPKRM